MPFDFSEMIHEERSACLRALPAFSGTVLSAGCAGSWYFDWFSKCTGHVGRHVGLELYSPKPPDLPPYVDWIANSVEHMEAVGDGEVDLVVSGQNVEHLTASSLAGFMIEANRVLRDDGLLVIDSPNRSVTQHLGYTQPEHSLELTVDEIVELLALAGFDVVETRGVWLVIDPASNRRMDITSCRPGELTAAERQQGARSRPMHSFIWWVNARKRRPADAPAVRRFVAQLFGSHYPAFVGVRFSSQVGTRRWTWGSSTIEVEPDDAGFALFGPYVPMAAGRYVAGFSVRAAAGRPAPATRLVFDIVSAHGTGVHGSRTIGPANLAGDGWTDVKVPFELDGYVTGLETRCHVTAFAGLVLGMASLLPLD